ncbi:class I SAM-dependent methyltransferase [Bosea beijingensis]|uniref:class I SAM-dependent methyltransferase n=1 Tax=Bosea beijingensis TaxID=3068632 RepID=UPI002741E7A6|nr:class I SAM-dependent methyltransferase [Bosea sp. REN20]
MPSSKKVVTILDVGGTESYWSDKIAMIKRDVHVTLLNIHQVETSAANFLSVAGDARNMPQFGDNQFDIVHSNSVIEHVGRWTDMVAMAQEVARVAPSYFVQTPYFWFPIEPHARTAFLHWLPEPIRYRIVMAFKCGFWSKCATVDSAMRTIQSSELIDIGMMKSLFPGSVIVKEKAFQLTKSIIAIK